MDDKGYNKARKDILDISKYVGQISKLDGNFDLVIKESKKIIEDTTIEIENYLKELMGE